MKPSDWRQKSRDRLLTRPSAVIAAAFTGRILDVAIEPSARRAEIRRPAVGRRLWSLAGILVQGVVTEAIRLATGSSRPAVG